MKFVPGHAFRKLNSIDQDIQAKVEEVDSDSESFAPDFSETEESEGVLRKYALATCCTGLLMLGLSYEFYTWFQDAHAENFYNSRIDNSYFYNPNAEEEVFTQPELGRRAEVLKSNAGILGRNFCRGGKKSILCK